MKTSTIVAILLTAMRASWGEQPTSRPAEDAASAQLPSESASKQSLRQTWTAHVSAPNSEGEALGELDEALLDLEKLIEASAKARAAAEARAQAATRPATQPTTAPAAASKAAAPAAAAPAPAEMVSLSQERLQNLRDMTQRRRGKLTEEDISTVIALGDTLFQAGRPQEAAMFYDMTLDKPDRPDDHAWALFQAANCRRTSDPEAAIGLYRRLVAEHPDTPWAFTAQMQHRLLEWKRMNRPEQSVRQAERSLGIPEAPAATTQQTQVSKND